MNPDANLLVFQYRRGSISPQQFINEMRDLQFSTQQIVQIMDMVNKPDAPRQLDLPQPDGNVLPPETYRRPDQPSSFSQNLPGPGQTAPAQQGNPRPLVLPPEAAGATPQPAGAPTRDQFTPNASGQPYYGMDDMPPGGNVLGQEQRFRPPYDEGQAQRFRPMPEAPSARVVAAAKQALATRAAPREQAAQPASEGPGFLTQLIRGDFREGADQRVNEAMRRQREESGVSEGMASGGAAGKKSSRDDVLHKALEIIHHMLTRR